MKKDLLKKVDCYIYMFNVLCPELLGSRAFQTIKSFRAKLIEPNVFSHIKFFIIELEKADNIANTFVFKNLYYDSVLNELEKSNN